MFAERGFQQSRKHGKRQLTVGNWENRSYDGKVEAATWEKELLVGKSRKNALI
jgi:hypothetical protein